MIHIVDETRDYVLAWKDANLPTTPTPEHPDSFIGRLIRQRPELSVVNGYKSEEFGLLNRLDNLTAGLIMAAKTQQAFDHLRLELKQELWTKIYLAYCYDSGRQEKGIIDSAIAHHPHDSARMVIAAKYKAYRGKPQPCQTVFEKISSAQARTIWKSYLAEKIPFPEFFTSTDRFTWICCRITRGKRHQIRLHLKTIGYPILGDDIYKPDKKHLLEKFEHYALYSVGFIKRQENDDFGT
jgi:23S rRNA pseudouridine1911/1915/1917 synthase